MLCRSCQRENREGGARLGSPAESLREAEARSAGPAVETPAWSLSDADLRRGLIASAAAEPL